MSWVGMDSGYTQMMIGHLRKKKTTFVDRRSQLSGGREGSEKVVNIIIFSIYTIGLPFFLRGPKR